MTRDFSAEINQAFKDFCSQQADMMIENHATVRGGVLVAIDGNGYISVASFALSPTGVNLLLADALELNKNHKPDVEKSMGEGDAAVEVNPPSH